VYGPRVHTPEISRLARLSGNWGSRPSPLAVRPTLVPPYVRPPGGSRVDREDKRVLATFVEVDPNQRSVTFADGLVDFTRSA